MYSGQGYGSLPELEEVPGMGMDVLQNSQKFRVGTRMLYPYPYPGIFTRAYPYPGYCATGVQTYRSSGYGYECCTELTEVPGTGNTTGMVLYVPYRTQPCNFSLFIFGDVNVF